MGILLDTGVLYASLDRSDRHHDAASRIVEAAARHHWGAPTVTDLVVGEFLTLVRRRFPAHMEENALRMLPPDPLITRLGIAHTTIARFDETQEVFLKYRDQGLSFTDANLVVAAEELGIYRIGTFDKAFEGLVEVVADAPTTEAAP